MQLVPESLVTAVNQTSKLFLTLSTTSLQNSSLSVDFGDNVSCTVAMHAAGMASAVNNIEVDYASCGGSDKIVRIFHGNYSSTCELHIEISHIYMIEGDFNVSVTTVPTGSEEITAAKNWTIVNVRSFVEDMSLLVESVVAVRSNVTVSVSLSPHSQFVKYHWTVSSFDFLHSGANSTLILPVVTDIPQLQLALSDAGDYLIEVTVANEISAANDSIMIEAVVPISGLALSCDNDKYFSANATFECVATVEEGTDVRFSWNVGDGMLTHIATTNSSLAVTLTYPAAGCYNIRVTASNHFSAKSAWTIANIIENIFRLSVLATEPVLAGQLVSVTACCALGSNLTLEFDFGSGYHQLVLDPQSRAVTASHVYSLPGVYIATVSAQNNVSMAMTRVTVRVLENVADVALKTITSLIAGRHSVFIATFNGNFLHLIFIGFKMFCLLFFSAFMLLFE